MIEGGNATRRGMAMEEGVGTRRGDRKEKG